MKSARSNFGSFLAKDRIYVFGGLSGKEKSHNPVLADVVCEAFDYVKNVWEEYKIEGLKNLCAFGFCPISGKEVAVYGGSDGIVISSDLFIVDFPGKKV